MNHQQIQHNQPDFMDLYFMEQASQLFWAQNNQKIKQILLESGPLDFTHFQSDDESLFSSSFIWTQAQSSRQSSTKSQINFEDFNMTLDIQQLDNSLTTQVEMPSKKVQRNSLKYQTLAQLVIYFITGYYYTKNFNQFLHPRIPQNFEAMTSEEKIQILRKIIIEVQLYNPKNPIYSKKSLQQFTILEQKLILECWRRCFKKVYVILLEVKIRKLEKQNLYDICLRCLIESKKIYK